MDWALLPLSTKGYLVQWSWECEVRFHGACRPPFTFPLFQGVVSSQHSLILGAGPYCGLTVHDQRCSSRTSTVG